MTLRYICDRCDLRAEAILGQHVCEAPARTSIDDSIDDFLQAIGSGFPFPGNWSLLESDCFRHLAPIALSRGYRWTLSQVGDGTEYRATFFCNIDTLASTALDRTPARAFARAWRRLPIESESTNNAAVQSEV